MTARNSSTLGRSLVHIEVARANELPAGLPAPNRNAEAEIRRDAQGRPADEASHRALSALGGRAGADKSKLARRVALGTTFADPRFEPYAKAAKGFRRLHVRQLAKSVGGGTCGPAPASIIASAALQLAASRYAFEILGEVQLGSKLANDSRQNLLAAHELCAREAKCRPSAFPDWWSDPAPAANGHADAFSDADDSEHASEPQRAEDASQEPQEPNDDLGATAQTDRDHQAQKKPFKERRKTPCDD